MHQHVPRYGPSARMLHVTSDPADLSDIYHQPTRSAACSSLLYTRLELVDGIHTIQ